MGCKLITSYAVKGMQVKRDQVNILVHVHGSKNGLL